MKKLPSLLIPVVLLLAGLSGRAQTAVMNSFPSATATVLLDFDGHTVEGTSWNTNGPLYCGPSNLNAAQINEIFQRIAEDYRPFNINVTTDTARYWAAPANQRMRVVFTVTSSWYGAAGGVSYIGSFAWGDNTPAFVFTALLGYNTKYIAEAGAHELGHTLGLRHQSAYDGNCVKTSEYNSGAGSGEIGWAPIMGVGYYRNFTLWNNGANPYGCTNYQDDLGIISGAQNGFGFRTDDHGNLADVSATSLALVNNAFQAQGIIEKITDQDVFRFTLPYEGAFHLDAHPYSIGGQDIGSDLDVQVELMNGSGAVVGLYNPSQILSSSIDTVLGAGVYFLRVSGKGNEYAPEYASLGSYDLSATYTPAVVLPVQRLDLSGAVEGSRHRLNWVVQADEPILAQQLEVSSGNGFHVVASGLPAAARSYAYTPLETGLLNYRLRLTLGSGQEYYSNVVPLRSKPWNKKIFVNGNVAAGALAVRSDSACAYDILDYSGRTVQKGNLAQGINTLAVDHLSSGIYIFRMLQDGQAYAEKFIRP